MPSRRVKVTLSNNNAPDDRERAMAQEQGTATVLQALQTLYHDPDSAAKKRANDWLEEFQHSVGVQCAVQLIPGRCMADMPLAVDAAGRAARRPHVFCTNAEGKGWCRRYVWSDGRFCMTSHSCHESRCPRCGIRSSARSPRCPARAHPRARARSSSSSASRSRILHCRCQSGPTSSRAGSTGTARTQRRSCCCCVSCPHSQRSR